MKDLQTPSLTRITTEIVFLKQQTAQNIIEIGLRLNTAKDMLPHGEWGKWLKKEVEFSQEQARRFMKVATELSNSTALWNLPQTKVFALFDLPSEEREEFVNTTHIVNGEEKTVDEMTTRELQKVIKEKSDLEKEKDYLQKQLDTANGTIQYQKEVITQKEGSIQKLAKQEPVIVEKEIEKIVEKEIIPEDYEKIRNSLEVIKISNTKITEAYSKVIKDKQLLEKEVESLKKVNAASGEYDSKVIESSIFFIGKVHNFIEQVGGFAWVAGEVNKLPDNERKAYLKAIQLVKDWANAVSFQIDTELGKYIGEKARS